MECPTVPWDCGMGWTIFWTMGSHGNSLAREINVSYTLVVLTYGDLLVYLLIL